MKTFAFVIATTIILTSVAPIMGCAQTPATRSTPTPPAPATEFDQLRRDGNEALYNLDYKGARERFQRMIAIAPERPSGYVSLANNIWLETLNSTRRLSTSLYSGDSFYVQVAESDKVDPKRDREFQTLIKQALAASTAILQKDPRDVSALYDQAAALGVRAGYTATVGRSFRRAISDANESIKLQRKVVQIDPAFYDAYLSIGFYEYVIDSLPFVWRVLARLAGLTGSKEKGIQHLEMVTRKGSLTADDARVLLIPIYAREGRLDRSLDQLGALAAKYPNNYLFAVERASMLSRMRKRIESDRAFAALLDNTRVSETAADLVSYQWGEALVAAHDYPKAVEQYARVIKWDKSDPGLVSLARLHSGEALDAQGKRDDAIAQYKLVLSRENIFDSHDLAARHMKAPYKQPRS